MNLAPTPLSVNGEGPGERSSKAMFMLLTDNIHQISGVRGTGIWSTNVFILVDGGLTLVDTGFKGRYVQILREIRKLGYTPDDVANIVVTHHHADHIGSLAKLKGITRAKVFAHLADAPYIDGKLQQPGPIHPRWLRTATWPLSGMWITAPVAVDTLIGDGHELPVMGGIRVVHVPGHTPGSICLLLQKKGLLIVGDLLSHTIGLRLPSRIYTADLAQEIQSIKKVAGLDFDIMAFGHGPPLHQKAQHKVARFASSLLTARGL